MVSQILVANRSGMMSLNKVDSTVMCMQSKHITSRELVIYIITTNPCNYDIVLMIISIK